MCPPCKAHGGALFGRHPDQRDHRLVALHRRVEIGSTWTARSAESNEPVALPEDIRDWLYRYVR